MQWVFDIWRLPIVVGNEVGHIVGFTLTLLFGFTFAKLLQILITGRFKKWAERTDTDFDDALLVAVELPIYYFVLGLTARLAIEWLVLPDVLQAIGGNVLTVVITVFVAWGITRVMDAIRLIFINPYVEASETKLDDQLVPIADKTLKAVVWSLAILIAFSNLGYDILSLLTGLGIGGLAVAMAAQATLSNLLGSITIFADQPFQAEDLISVSGHTGVVTDVGLRACRIRTFEGFTVTIPNASIVDEAVVNHTVDHRWRHQFVIGLEYDTSIDQLEHGMDLLRGVLENHSHVQDHAVRFLAFADSALELHAAFFVSDTSVADFLDTQSEVNLAIKRAFDEAGLGMAFPSMSVYVPHGVSLSTPG